MTSVELDIAKQHEAELLQALRIADIIKSKLMRSIDGGEGWMLDIEYNEKKNCLRYVMEGVDDDYTGTRIEYADSIDELIKENCIDIDDDTEEET